MGMITALNQRVHFYLTLNSRILSIGVASLKLEDSIGIGVTGRMIRHFGTF